jgi:poly(hydroxyalkanoate) depolymerase family esterase
MKPYEQFVDRMLKAVRSSQGKDPLAATDIIQQALRSAGLMPDTQATSQAPAAPFEPAAPFVDLNEAPAWARQKTRPAKPDANAGPVPDWTERMQAQLKAFQAGQGKARAPRDLANEPGQFLHGSFANEAGERSYRLYVPARPAAGPRPLVVMLHGCKQDPEDFAAGTTMNALAEEHGCLVLYPEQAGSANASHCWNWFETPHQQRDLGEPSILAGMTRAVMDKHDADPARVFVAGLSAGGAMAAVVAAAYPELYAAVGVHSGLPVGGAHDLMSGLNAMRGARGKKSQLHRTPARPVPAIVFHGDQDQVVHPSNGEAVYRQFNHGREAREVEESGKEGHAYTKTTALDGEGRTVAEHWLLHGAGHAWSGGSPAGSHADAAGPNASAEMLRFFLSLLS